MSGYTKFDEEIYSEESYPVTESEHDEVMRLMADEGYHEWSEQLESETWRGAKNVAGVLIKKACEHSSCSHFKCERGLRIGGFEL
jgi:hypothetical protein